MKGIIFKYFEEFAIKNHSLKTWDSILNSVSLENGSGIFVSPKTYKDDDFFNIANRMIEITNSDLNETLVGFGEFTLEKFSQDFPIFFEPQMTAKSFLLSIDCVIHVEVKKLDPEAITPKFKYESPEEDRLIMHYFSQRKLCPFLRGLLNGVGYYFKEEISYEEKCCMHKGSNHCNFLINFSKQPAVNSK